MSESRYGMDIDAYSIRSDSQEKEFWPEQRTDYSDTMLPITILVDKENDVIYLNGISFTKPQYERAREDWLVLKTDKNFLSFDEMIAKYGKNSSK